MSLRDTSILSPSGGRPSPLGPTPRAPSSTTRCFNRGTSTPRVLLRVFVDQAVGSPLTIVLTFGLSSLLRGQPETFLPRLQDQGLPTWAQAACFWPFVHVYNFSRVPVSRQALFAHVASVYWSAALSYRVNKQPVVEGESPGGGGVETQAELRELCGMGEGGDGVAGWEFCSGNRAGARDVE